MSEIKVRAGLVLSEGCEGRLCSRLLSLACRWLSSPCVSLHFLLSLHALCPNFPIFIRTRAVLD